MAYNDFCAWLLSFNIMVSTFIYLVECISTSLLLRAELSSFAPIA